MSRYVATLDKLVWEVHTEPPSRGRFLLTKSEAEANIIAWALNMVANGGHPEGWIEIDGMIQWIEYDGPTEGVKP